jgi:hypothetical protein
LIEIAFEIEGVVVDEGSKLGDDVVGKVVGA